jgi:hypothetical protein
MQPGQPCCRPERARAAAGLVPVIVSRVRSPEPSLAEDLSTQQLLRARVARTEAVARLLLSYAPAADAPVKPQRVTALVREAVEATLVPDHLAEAADLVRTRAPRHTHTDTLRSFVVLV